MQRNRIFTQWITCFIQKSYTRAYILYRVLLLGMYADHALFFRSAITPI